MHADHCRSTRLITRIGNHRLYDLRAAHDVTINELHDLAAEDIAVVIRETKDGRDITGEIMTQTTLH